MIVVVVVIGKPITSCVVAVFRIDTPDITAPCTISLTSIIMTPPFSVFYRKDFLNQPL